MVREKLSRRKLELNAIKALQLGFLVIYFSNASATNRKIERKYDAARNATI
jgi:hypothetical protein